VRGLGIDGCERHAPVFFGDGIGRGITSALAAARGFLARAREKWGLDLLCKQHPWASSAQAALGLDSAAG